MRVLVTGDRNWDRRVPIRAALRKCVRASPEKVIVAEGGAKGADTCARDLCDILGITHITYWANWNGHHKAAGPIRNRFMLEDFKPDLVLAFHPNLDESKGTADMVKRARKAGIPVVVHE